MIKTRWMPSDDMHGKQSVAMIKDDSSTFHVDDWTLMQVWHMSVPHYGRMLTCADATMNAWLTCWYQPQMDPCTWLWVVMDDHAHRIALQEAHVNTSRWHPQAIALILMDYRKPYNHHLGSMMRQTNACLAETFHHLRDLVHREPWILPTPLDQYHWDVALKDQNHRHWRDESDLVASNKRLIKRTVSARRTSDKSRLDGRKSGSVAKKLPRKHKSASSVGHKRHCGQVGDDDDGDDLNDLDDDDETYTHRSDDVSMLSDMDDGSSLMANRRALPTTRRTSQRAKRGVARERPMIILDDHDSDDDDHFVDHDFPDADDLDDDLQTHDRDSHDEHDEDDDDHDDDASSDYDTEDALLDMEHSVMDSDHEDHLDSMDDDDVDHDLGDHHLDDDLDDDDDH